MYVCVHNSFYSLTLRFYIFKYTYIYVKSRCMSLSHFALPPPRQYNVYYIFLNLTDNNIKLRPIFSHYLY